MSRWHLQYNNYDPEQEKLREALCTLGNGYFATRGAASESHADEIHYPGTYLAGGYDRLTTHVHGKDIENEDLVNMPNWLPVQFRVAREEWFTLEKVRILDYRQDLNIRGGILSREVHFEDNHGRRSMLKERRIVHMRTAHLAALEIRLIPENWSEEVEILTALDGSVVNGGVERYKQLRSDHLETVETEHFESDMMLVRVRTRQSRMEVTEAARTRVLLGGKQLDPERKSSRDGGYISQQLAVEAKQEEEIRIEKVVSIYSSRDAAIAEPGYEARKAVRRAKCFEELLGDHVETWEHLWKRFDMKIKTTEGVDEDHTSMILHLHIFHLLQTTSTHTIDLDVGVPSRGWHGEAYRGHIFWDELFIFPLLNLRLPEITRSLLLYRYRRLDEARELAKKSGYRGALYPWQSGSDGEEESQRIHLNPRSGRWIPDNTWTQRHINAAIAWNIWQYFESTLDIEFISFYGAEMFLEIARFWASISKYNSKLERYEIHNVMGPDEYHTAYPGSDEFGISNNAYTNLMAAWVLMKSSEVLSLLPEVRQRELKENIKLDSKELEEWDRISRKLRLLFHDGGIISQFQGYEKLEELDWDRYTKEHGFFMRLDRILEAEGDSTNRYKASKQADVLMLFYLFSSEELQRLFERLGYKFDRQTIPRNVDYYLERTSHGSTLSGIVHSWVLARTNREKSWNLFTNALESDVADIQGGTTPEGIHLGAMAGSVDLMQRCYGGIDIHDDVLCLNPCPPDELRGLEMQIHYRGHTFDIFASCDILKIKCVRSSSRPVRIAVREDLFRIREGEYHEFRLNDRERNGSASEEEAGGEETRGCGE